jgi:hypothetical protein
MKTLSIRQPWAWAILHAGKCLENRSRTASYRGPLLLHAARRPAPQYATAAALIFENSGHWPPPFRELPAGCIVGAACLCDVRRPQDFDESWQQAGLFGWVLDDVVPLPSRPMRGQQSLFEVAPTDDELHLLRRAGLL